MILPNEGSTVVRTPGFPEPLSDIIRTAAMLIIQAFSTNSQPIRLGGPNVSAFAGMQVGVELTAGQTYQWRSANLNQIYIASTVANEGVNWRIVDT